MGVKEMLGFSGMLFDLDGTLVNSLEKVEDSWKNWAVSKGLCPQEVLRYLHGKPAQVTFRHFLTGASDEEILRECKALEDYEVADAAGMTAVDGAIDLLNTLQRLAIPWAIVTSGLSRVATARIAAAGLPRPNALITCENVTLGKPHPQAFLLGAQRLNCSPARCIAFEDSLSGLASAKAADCTVIELVTAQSVKHTIACYLSLKNYLPLEISTDGDGFGLNYRE